MFYCLISLLFYVSVIVINWKFSDILEFHLIGDYLLSWHSYICHLRYQTQCSKHIHQNWSFYILLKTIVFIWFSFYVIKLGYEMVDIVVKLTKNKQTHATITNKTIQNRIFRQRACLHTWFCVSVRVWSANF